MWEPGQRASFRSIAVDNGSCVIARHRTPNSRLMVNHQRPPPDYDEDLLCMTNQVPDLIIGSLLGLISTLTGPSHATM